jgi:hypothetical protein
MESPGFHFTPDPVASEKVHGWDPVWNHCLDGSGLRIHTCMNNHPKPPTVPEIAALQQHMDYLDERLGELLDRLDALEQDLFNEDGELSVDRVVCRDLRVGDGSCRFPIGMGQAAGESFLAIPGGTGGAMVLVGAEADGKSLVLGTDPQGAVRWAVGFDPGSGCVLPKEDLRLLGEEGPWAELRAEVRNGIARGLELRGVGCGMPGLTG